MDLLGWYHGVIGAAFLDGTKVAHVCLVIKDK